MKVELLVVLLYVCCGVLQSQELWDVERDDLSEYKLDRSSFAWSSSQCVFMALSKHHAVEFSAADGACRMYSCLFGWSGCRKCRNARNSSLPLLMVRRLDQLRRTCWQTFQHRVDDSVDFYRNWSDYVSGFGQGEDRNYWMGLEALHQLTKAGDTRVRWEMSLWNGSWYWWEDMYFAVQNSNTNYRVLVGDQDISRSNVVRRPSINDINEQQFSTPDNDHDQISDNCAAKYRSAWWHEGCHSYSPNGRYFTPPDAFTLTGSLLATGITFVSFPTGVYPFDYTYSMRTFECLLIV